MGERISKGRARSARSARRPRAGGVTAAALRELYAIRRRALSRMDDLVRAASVGGGGDRARFRQVAEMVGFPVSARARCGADRPAWDGRTYAARGESVSDAYHDLAHFQVASPSRRPLPNYGLGAGPSDHHPCAQVLHYGGKGRARFRSSLGEELLASLLGALWEREAGRDPAATLAHHNWFGGDRVREERELAATARELLRLGLVDRHLRPLPVTRAKDDRRSWRRGDPWVEEVRLARESSGRHGA